MKNIFSKLSSMRRNASKPGKPIVCVESAMGMHKQFCSLGMCCVNKMFDDCNWREISKTVKFFLHYYRPIACEMSDKIFNSGS
jgi:hypothetical protein